MSEDTATPDIDPRTGDGRAEWGERTPLLVWAGFSLASVLLRSVAVGGGWGLDRWEVLSQWESHTILQWADNGEATGDFVMPGYALLVRGTQWITGDLLTTAVLITYLSAAVASVLLWRWAGARETGGAGTWAVVALLAFPYSFVLFGVVGPEALGLALVLACFVLLDEDRGWLAGVAAAAAITVMATALAVVPALAVLAWQGSRRSGAADPRGAAGAHPVATSGAGPALLVSLLGPVALCAFSIWDLGNPWSVWTGDGIFAGVQTGVLRAATWLRGGWVFEDSPASWMLNRTVQTALIIAFAVLSYWVWRRYGAAFAALVLGVVFLTLASHPEVTSSARHLTAAFPVAALAGCGLSRLPRPASVTIAAVGAVMAGGLYVAFVKSVGYPFW